MYEIELAEATYSKSKAQPLTTVIVLNGWIGGFLCEFNHLLQVSYLFYFYINQ